MNRISYKFSFVFIYFTVIIISFFILFFAIDNSKITNINEVSSNKFYEDYKNKNSKIQAFIKLYKDSLFSLSQNQLFHDYLENQKNKRYVDDLFASYIKFLPNVFQLRYIDKYGFEKIRVEKNHLENSNNIFITKKDLLQDKSNSTYFKKFIKLKENELGLSNINLNKEHGKVDKNRTITLRLAYPIYFKDKTKKGFLVLNIDLEKFFNILKNSSFYNVMLIDEKGRFLLHYAKKRGLRTSSFETFDIYNELGKNAALKILNNDSFSNEKIFSRKIALSNEKQNIKIIFKSKFDSLNEKQKDNELLIYVFIVFLALLFLPITLYFSKKPESLRNQINLQNVTDPLTKLPNKQHLINNLENSYYSEFVLVLICIDNYEKIQNVYGYKIADKIIIKCSIFLKRFTKQNDAFKLYKTSKNHFALLFKNINKENLKSLQNRIENNYDDFELLVSIGTSSKSNTNKKLEKLQEATIALDVCNKEKIDICFYEESLAEDITINKKNLQTVKVIRDAIKNDDVVIQFQAIYNNIKNKIDKYETLVRIKKDDKLIYPNDFISIAKDIKKYKTLTKIVIDKSFEYFKDKDYEFSINLTLEDINDEEIKSHLFKQIKHYNISEKLVLEIVESEAIENIEEFKEFLKDIKSYGCQVAIDDFGSGYSNYEYIIKLSEYIDYVKLDGSLITTVHKDPKVHVLVGSIKFICDTLQIKLIAEYVEDLELFEYVKSMGIDYSQGYYIGKSQNKVD